MKPKIVTCVLVAGLLALLPSLVLGAGAARDRSEIDDRYKWDLTDVYPDLEAWQADFERAEELAAELGGLQDELGGKLGDSGDTILDLYRRMEAAEELGDQLATYAYLKSDEDTRDSQWQGLKQQLQSLSVKISTSLSWIEPELLAIPQDKMQGFLDSDAALKIYQHHFDDLWRQQTHVLSEKEERILSLTGEMAGTPRSVYGQMMNADLKFDTFLDESGEEVEMTQARYGTYMANPNRDVREKAWSVYYDGYDRYVHTATAAYAGSVKRDIFYMRARGYESCAQMSLDSDNVPVSVLENLIATISDNMEPVRKYNLIRQRVMEVDTLRHWDSYVSLVPSLDEEIPFDEAVSVVTAGLAPLGEDYLKVMKTGFESRWIDVYENAGKRSGAYSWGSFAVPHPYMLLNYESRLDDVFTLAHEMGHSMHTWHSVKSQPQVYSGYTLFVAEVASTTNEAILMDHLLSRTTDREKRIFLLNHSIKEILGTIYTQVMFSEFEKAAHEMAEAGQPLTIESLSEVYAGLLDKYACGVIGYTDRSAVGWCRIPHFYRPFYVYKYATSYAAALAIADRILQGEPGALDSYIGFLSNGSSEYPIDLLKGAGVDMSTPAPIQAACDRLADMVDELDALLRAG